MAGVLTHADETEKAEVLLAGVESGELDVRADEVGEELVAELAFPYPRLAEHREALAARRVLIVTGGIESDQLPWLPHAVEGYAQETHPGELFSRVS